MSQPPATPDEAAAEPSNGSVTAEPARPPRRRHPLLFTVIGLLVLALAGTAGWFGWGTDVLGRSHARTAITALTDDWASAPADPVQASRRPGAVMALISIPSLGLTWPVVVGTDNLDRGVGWYPGTSWPGERGNAALAGRRVTGGSPFRQLDRLAKGDRIIVATASATLTYEVTVAPSELTVAKDAGWVLDPVPGHPGAEPTASLLTLTTAQDLIATSERSVCFATLVSSQPR